MTLPGSQPSSGSGLCMVVSMMKLVMDLFTSCCQFQSQQLSEERGEEGHERTNLALGSLCSF